MPDCPFYQSKPRLLESREIRGRSTPPPSRATLEWCEHPKHSPCDRERAMRPKLGRNLTCNGMLATCMIPEQYEDQD